MKKLLVITMLGLLTTTIGFAQTAYNPFTQNIHFSPEPTAQGFECNSIQSVEFVQGMTTIDDATDWQNNPLTVSICLTGFTFNGPASTAVTGSYASNFNWEYDSFAPNCVIGTQKQSLAGTGNDPFTPNPAASGLIKVSLKVPETSPISTVLAVNVNLQVPGYMSQFNSTPDDNESTQTQTFCALKISGNVYRDITLNNTVDGTPISIPSGEQLFASLVGPNGLVVATMPIGTDGKYQFLNVSENTAYTIVLSTTAGTVGAAAPTPQLPSTWTNLGEVCCGANGEDVNPNGIINVNVVRASVINNNFGINSPIALPTKVNYFFATESNCAGLLSWSTSQEVNTSHVNILRKQSANGSYIKIAKIQAAGNATTEKSYSYLDRAITSDGNTHEYQLEFVDLDGQSTLSEVRKLALMCSENTSSINVFPNPTSSNINVFYTTSEVNETLSLQVVDVTGRTIMVKNALLETGTNIINLDMAPYAAGLYFIKYKEVIAGMEGSIKFNKN